jgi:hypothetical protein
MNCCIEPLLKVDSLAETVGANQHTLLCLAKLFHAGLTFIVRKLPRDTTNLNTLEAFAELVCDVLRCRDIAAEHDGAATFREQFLHKVEQASQLSVLLTT